MRSISSSETASAVRSYSFVVFGRRMAGNPVARARASRRSTAARSDGPPGRRSETAAPSRPRCRRRQRDTPRPPPRPGGAPARRGACRLSRAAAATPAAPAGSSPGAASPPPRSPARSWKTITLRSARSRSPTRVPVSIRSRSSRVSAGVRTGVAPLVTTCFGPRTDAAGFDGSTWWTTSQSQSTEWRPGAA